MLHSWRSNSIRLLEEEARQREAFREWIDDNVKAEFINGGSLPFLGSAKAFGSSPAFRYFLHAFIAWSIV